MDFDPTSAVMEGDAPGAVTAPKTIFTNPNKPASSAATWRDLTEEEQQAHPGGVQISSRGQVKMGPGGDNAPLNPTAVDILSDYYAATGELPGMGQDRTQRTQILNAFADKVKAIGGDGTDFALHAADFKANRASLLDTVKRRTTIASFEGQVEDALTLAQTQADKALSNTGFATTNKIANWYKKETQDPEFRGLSNAVKTVTNEYARVISGATNNGITSDAAREHAESMLSEADSPVSFKAAVKVLRAEMDYRIKNIDKEINRLNHQIHLGMGTQNVDIGQGDYAQFIKAWKDKHNTEYGGQQAFQVFRRANPTKNWREGFPDLKASPAAAAPQPQGLRWNPEKGDFE